MAAIKNMASAIESMAEMERRELERLRYWQGQKLSSQDFNDLAQIEAQLRWWHNRALHAIPGVLEGLAVRLEGGFVIISPGLAYDGFGRELIHAQETILPLPDPVPQAGLFLVAYARSSGQGQEAQTGACLPFQGGTQRKRLNFTWVRANEIGAQSGVRLGRLYRMQDGLHFDPERRFVRPIARPRTASGSTIPGATDWELWKLEVEESLSEPVIGLQVRVDASAAGFTRPPCYFAWLHAVNWMGGQEKRLNLLNTLTVEHIDEVSIHGFTFRLIPLFAGLRSQAPSSFLFNFIQKVKPYVCWIGIEPGPAHGG